MKIAVTSVYVDDQEKALKFYTEILGFVKKVDMPAGPMRWLTVASPENPDGVQLLLEPNADPISKTYQDALFAQGISAALFACKDLPAEYERLKNLGVKFRKTPVNMGPVMMSDFEDTCGNIIQLMQVMG